MKSNKPIVAVDPGVSGGFAVNTPDGIILLSMPESLPEICATINQLKTANAELWIEELPLFASPMTKSSSMAVLHRNLGRIEAAGYAYGYSVHRATPKAWQAALGRAWHGGLGLPRTPSDPPCSAQTPADVG